MSIEILIPFILASTLILILPGPTILLVVSQAVTHGKRSVIPLVSGVFLGDLTAMTLSLLGLGTIMTASAALFTIFKWIGALYLIYLGINLFRADKGEDTNSIEDNGSSIRLFRRSFIVTALNPKSIAFFVAFLPQFIDSSKPALSQMVWLGGIFLFLAVLNSSLYALFAGHIRDHMEKGNVKKWFGRFGGGGLMGAGIFTAAMERS